MYKTLKIPNEVIKPMRLTIEQRITAMERQNVVLEGKIMLLHKLLKEQHQLIHDYITQRVGSANQTETRSGNTRPEDVLYTVVCKRKFDRLEKSIDRINKSVSNSNLDLKAG
jgi:SMC interacting uncharacterized protein involved in chromosome segregation